MRLAVIIPALDEEGSLRRHLPQVVGLGDELVVSDGGSSDGTVAVARRLGARVVEGARGRGPQLNRGAAATEAEILLFLHADSLPPAGAAKAIRRAVAEGAEGGGFRLEFETGHALMRLGPTRRPADAAHRTASRRPGAFRHPRRLRGAWWLSRLADPGRPRLRPPIAPPRPPDDPASHHADLGPALPAAGHRSDRRGELADLAALRPRRIAAPPGPALPRSPLAGPPHRVARRVAVGAWRFSEWPPPW